MSRLEHLDPTIKKQQILFEQLCSVLQADVLTEVRRATQGIVFEFSQRTEMAADSLKITSKTMPELYTTCEEVKSNIGFEEPIDFYIQGSPQVNAYSYYSEDPNKPHIVVINSALFNLMEEPELRYILGHEIGHLINKDSYIKRLYSFIYPEEDVAPEIIETRMKQYDQLCEYAADRYGFLGCLDLEACISACYKMTSGIDLKKMNVSIDSLIEQNYDNIDILFNNRAVQQGDHPDIPLRIQALIGFAKFKSQKRLDEMMDEFYELIPGMCHGEMHQFMAQFVGSAGILLATHDGKIDKSEKDMIIEEIAKYTLEASKEYKRILRVGPQQQFEEAVSVIMDRYPSLSGEMLSYYIKLAFADKNISKIELDAIKGFGKKIGFEDDDVYGAIRNELKENYYSIADGL
jgi:Zn-dependent protease with chaperone function